MIHIRDHVGRPNPAVVLHLSGIQVTFAQLEAQANQLAHHLRAAGLLPGDTIAVLMENDRHVHAVMWAARRSGLHYTLVNTHLTVSEIAYVLRDSGAKAIVASAVMRDVCAALGAELPEGLPAVALLADVDLPGWQRLFDCLRAHPTTPIDDESDGQLLQYSAGSTGRPKGIRRTAEPSSTQSRLSTPVFEALGVAAGSVYLSPAPIHHTAPAMWSMAAQAIGATTVLMEGFDAQRALECIERYGVTHAQFVPTMFVRMLRLPAEIRNRHDLSSLQRVVHAAAPCPPGIKRQMLDWWGPIIDEYYGSSEGAGITFIRAEDWLTHPGSVGRPLLGEPHVLDEQGRELPAGEVGELYFGGGYPFEYLNDAPKTAAGRSAEGWVSVGDVGFVDDDGYVYLTDRKHHMIISGGVNVYPQEAEHVLVSHPLVVDVAMFGVPDEVLGQRAMAVVELVDPTVASDALAAELMAWVRGRLAPYKCPRTIVFEDRLPRTDAGKLAKRPLVEKYSGQRATGQSHTDMSPRG